MAVVSHVSPIKTAVAWALDVGIEIAWRSHLSQASVCRIDIRRSRSGALLVQRGSPVLSPECSGQPHRTVASSERRQADPVAHGDHLADVVDSVADGLPLHEPGRRPAAPHRVEPRHGVLATPAASRPAAASGRSSSVVRSTSASHDAVASWTASTYGRSRSRSSAADSSRVPLPPGRCGRRGPAEAEPSRQVLEERRRAAARRCTATSSW